MKIFIQASSKIIVFLFFFSLLNSTNAQIVNIPDPNFKSTLIQSNVDINNDGEIQFTEAQSITTDLSLNNKNISDLTGIKSFTNLKNLYCGPNNLTNVDLSGMINLQHVYLGNNNLTNINVNGMTDLRYLHCESNQLTSINLDGLLYLKYLNLSGNQFSTLHINNLPSLEIFHFYNNNMPVTLSFGTLPNLKTIDASNSQLTSINLSGLQTLKILNCSNNQLNSLSFNDGLVQNLQYLNVSGNPIQFICKDGFDLLPSTNPVQQLTNACILSTKEILKEDEKILIHPNPAKEYISLSLKVKEIKIFNLEGRIILDRKDNKELKINISHLPTGIYLLKTEVGNAKFIKE